MHLVFEFTPEADAQSALKFKIEINTLIAEKSQTDITVINQRLRLR